MRSWYVRVTTALALALLVAAVSMRPTTSPRAAAQPHAPAGTLKLTADSTTFTYGGTPSGPIYTATLTLAAAVTPDLQIGFQVQVDGTQIFGQTLSQVLVDTTKTVYTQKIDGRTLPGGLLAGTHTAVALGILVGNNTPDYQSAPVPITINKATPQLACTNPNAGSLLSPGQTLTIGITFMGNSPPPPAEWQNTKYNFTFAGPSPITYTNLPPAPNPAINPGGPIFNLQVPSTPGAYQLTCTYLETSNFATATASAGTVTVSLMRPLTDVQLYTNPTTLASGQPVDMEVVFHAGSGCPVPATYFSIDLIGGGSYYFTKTIPINPGGDTMVHLGPLPNLNGVTNVRVDYPGDPCYASAGILFPLTNPPIPGAGGGSGGSGGAKSPTATTAPSPIATRAATVAAATAAQPTPATAAADAHRVYASRTPWYQRGGALWWIILAALLVLGGAGGGAYWWMRRGRPAALTAAPDAPTTAEPADAPPPPPDTEG